MNDQNTSLSKGKKIGSWALQITAAAIFVIAALPKLVGDPASVELFTRLGVEPFGRITAGVIEFIAVALLLTPRTVIAGAALGLVTISGAIFAHLTVLGISLGEEDGGAVFTMALIVFAATSGVLFLRRRKVFSLVAPILAKA